MTDTSERNKVKTKAKILELNRDIVAKCKCGGQLWYIIVDKPKINEIKGIQCSFCGEIIDLNKLIS